MACKKLQKSLCEGGGQKFLLWWGGLQGFPNGGKGWGGG